MLLALFTLLFLFQIPPSCKEFLFEIEFGVVIGKTGYKIPKSAVDKHVGGYCIALDMTSKDHWVDANKNGHPWTMSKCFDASTAIGNFIDKSRIPDPENVQMWLNLNGTQRQSENTGNMIFPVDFLIEHISKDMTLEEGDLIITGTPLGFDSVQKGDIIEAGFQGIDSVKFFVAKD